MQTTYDQHLEQVLLRNEKDVLKLSNFLNYQQHNDLLSSQTLHPIKILPYNITEPYLLSVPTLERPFKDPYSEIIYAKHKFNNDVVRLRSLYQRARRKNRYNIDILDFYKRMQDLMDTNPDPFFNSSYNWYYCGGTLDICELNDSYLVAHASESSNLCLTKIASKNSEWHIRDQKLINLTSNPIHEVKYTCQNKNLLIGARSKTSFNLYKVDSEIINNHELIQQKQSSKNIPYISFCFLEKSDQNKYAILNAKQSLEVRDLNSTKKKIYSVTKIINTLGENWGKVKYLEGNQIFYCNAISYSKTDLREGLPDTILTSELNFGAEKVTDFCFKDDNSFFLSTEKHVYEIDSRKNEVIKKWSHLLREKIFLSDFTRSHNEDLAVFGTNNPQERVILGSDSNNLKLPLLAPCLMKSLDNFLLSDNELMQEFIVRERVAMTTTGLKLVKNNNSVSIFTANTIGDLYVNEIYDSNIKTLNFSDRIATEFQSLDQKIFLNIEKSNPLYFIDKIVIKSLNSSINLNRNTKPERQNYLQHYHIACIKDKLKRQAENCKTFLNGAWEVEHPINAIDEIENNLNVQMWLNKIGDNVAEDTEENQGELGIDQEYSERRNS